MNFSFNAAPSNGGTGPSFGSTPFARPAQVSEPVARPTSAPRKLNEEREFIVDSYPLFASLQRIVAEYEATLPVELRSISTPPPPEQVQYYARISSLYRQAMLKQLSLVQANTRLTDEEKQTRLQHYSTMHSILSLTEILYLPADGTGDGVVGEELLDWLNVVDRAPSAEEGTELSTLSRPWESPTFFPYLTRCLLRGHTSSLVALVDLVISSHGSNPIRQIASTFLDLYRAFPRSTTFKTELEFRSALKLFRATAKRSLATIERLYDEAVANASATNFEDEEAQEFVTSFRILFEIVTLSTTETDSFSSSSPPSSLETLSSQCETWQEFLIAYLVYYEPLATRHDLATILASVVLAPAQHEHSIDHTLLEEKVQEKLFKGDVTGLLKTLVDGNGDDEYDDTEGDAGRGEWLWLATHLIDLLSHLNLPAFDIPDAFEGRRRRGGSEDMDEDAGAVPGDREEQDDETLGPRERFLLNYADTLIAGDETLWRVCCDYWGECGRVGKARISALLSDRDMNLVDSEDEEAQAKEAEQQPGAGSTMDLETQPSSKVERQRASKNVEEVLTVLGEYGMEAQVKTVCQTFAERLIQRKKFGKAIAYCVRANDTQRVDRIAYHILDEYVDQGQESFIAHVDSLPTSLLRPPSDGRDSPAFATAAFQYPLVTFLSRYRDFLALYSLASQRAAANASRGTDDEADASAAAAEAEEETWRMKRQSAELLILLLTSGMAPKRFWAIMLLDSVGLLETQPPLVSLAETYELLRVLEEVTAPIELSGSAYLDDDDDDGGEDSSESPVDIFGDLDMLGRLLEGQGKEQPTRTSTRRGGGRTKRALMQLEIVRGALARHLAICCCL